MAKAYAPTVEDVMPVSKEKQYETVRSFYYHNQYRLPSFPIKFDDGNGQLELDSNDADAEQLSRFVASASYEDISRPALDRLKGSVLDTLGCAISALTWDPPRAVASFVREFGPSRGPCSLVGGGEE